MPNDDERVTPGERIIRIDERTRRIERDISEIKETLNRKADNKDVERVEKIALSRQSKKVCETTHKAIDEKVDTQKSDWKWLIGTILAMIAIALTAFALTSGTVGGV